MSKNHHRQPPSERFRDEGDPSHSNNKEKRDYFSDKEHLESGPSSPQKDIDKNEGNTRPQQDPIEKGMDYFEEGEGNVEREKESQLKPPRKKRRKKAA